MPRMELVGCWSQRKIADGFDPIGQLNFCFDGFIAIRFEAQ